MDDSMWRRITRSEKNGDLQSDPAPLRARRSCILIPDLHVPYHSESLFEQMLERVRSASWVFIMGDLLDAYTLSSFDKNPARKASFKDERDEGRSILDRIRMANHSAEMHFIEGNHEDRLRRFLWRRAPELADMPELTIRSQLALDSYNIHYHPMSGFKKWGARFKHGDVATQYTAEAEMRAHRCNGFSVHTHRMRHTTFIDKEGVRTDWWEGGHGCDASRADYTESPNWHAGHLELLINEHNGIDRVVRHDLVAA